MNQTYLQEISQPELEDPLMIVGLPGIGNIGRMTARHLIEFSRARLFAELYSPVFADYVFIDKMGVCRPPRYGFYASTRRPNLVILTGNSQPAPEDILAHYEICGDVLDFVTKLGCRSIITIEGAPSPQPTEEIYIAATSKKQTKEYVDKGAVIYKGGRIVGIPRLLTGLAGRRGLKGICLLGSTTGLTTDRETAIRVFKFIRKVLGTPGEE